MGKRYNFAFQVSLDYSSTSFFAVNNFTLSNQNIVLIMTNSKAQMSHLQNKIILSGILSFFGLLQVAEMNVKFKNQNTNPLLRNPCTGGKMCARGFDIWMLSLIWHSDFDI